ncbi:hypothetical protein [Paraglaciecola sp.]|uniref:hypothetical protein n=1 Tax=Paraglaciecola sp. TaxID=1920173 RepID=UPI003EF28F00
MKLNKLLLILLTVIPLGMANAIVIPADVSVQGTVGFDDVNSYVGGTSQSDSMGAGGNSSSVNDGIVTGDNPVTDQLTNPLFVNANLSATNQEVDFDFFSYSFEVLIENNMATDAEFFFTFDYSQNLTANGDDAGVSSSISLFDDMDDEIILSNVDADSFFGPLSDSKSDSVDFSFNVASGSQLSFGGSLDLTMFAYGTSSFSALTDFSLSLTKVKYQSTDVPAPAMLSAFLIAALMMLRRKKL